MKIVKQVEINGRIYGLHEDGSVVFRYENHSFPNGTDWMDVRHASNITFQVMCRLVHEFENVLPFL
jgi:hypothetical protein